MQSKTIKTLATNGLIAAVYVVLTMINPLSWGALQFRVSDLLGVFPYYKKNTTAGLLIGIAIANLFSPLGIIDIAFGVVADGLAIAIFVWGFGKNAPVPVKCIGRAVSIGGIIGIELTWLYNTPFLVNAIPTFIAEIIIFIVGYIILRPVCKYMDRFEVC